MTAQAMPPLPPPKPLPPPAPPPHKAADDKRWAWLQSGAVVLAICASAVAATWQISAKVDEARKELGAKMDENRRELAGRVDETRKDVADLRSEVSRQAGTLAQMDTRITRIETKLGMTSDPDGGVGRTWNADHIARREKFCRGRCKADVNCFEKCAADYNTCGIKCPSDPASDCFHACVQALQLQP